MVHDLVFTPKQKRTVTDFLKEYIDNVHIDFIAEAEVADDICACSTLNYDDCATTVDYRNKLVRMLYLLKYYPAYLCQYCLLYQSLLNSSHLEKEIRVLSIGCGSGVDGQSLSLIHRFRNDRRSLDYRGIDIVKWEYRRKSEQMHFSNRGLIEWLSRYSISKYNVFVFPKSLYEMQEEAIIAFCNKTKNTTFLHRNIYLLIARKTGADSKDRIRTNKILTAFLNAGYVSAEKYQPKPQLQSDPKIGYVKRCNGFVYPDEIKDGFCNIKDKCNKYNNGCTEPKCKLESLKSPLLYCKAMESQYFTLTRSE